MPDIRGDMHGWRAKADLSPVILAELRSELTIGDFDTIQPFKEINMEERAPEFTVGDAVQARRFLLFHDL